MQLIILIHFGYQLMGFGSNANPADDGGGGAEEANGQQLYGSAGSYSWTAPAGITIVHVVCIGAGGGSDAVGSSGQTDGAGGGGGGGKSDSPASSPTACSTSPTDAVDPSA